jgi:carboxypeptidase PM20D1
MTVHPMQTIEEVVEYDKQLISDERILVEVQGLPIAPHPISPYDNNAFGFQIIKRSIRQVFSGSVVIPGIMIANTDTKFVINEIITDSSIEIALIFI